MRPRTENTSWLGVRWGAAISALLHLAIAAAVLLVLPEPKKPQATPRKVPVEIVRPLEKKPEKKKPAKKLAKKKPSTAVKAKPKPVPKEPKKEAKPKPPEKPTPPEKQKPLFAEKAKPKPPPEPKKAAPKPKMALPKKADPKIAEPVREPPRMPLEKKPKPPKQKPIPKKVEKRLAEKKAKAKPKGGGRKVKPNPYIDNQISMIQRKLVGRWILQPLKVNLREPCGRASISGFINLTKKRGNRFFGTLRTTIRWARCPPEGMLRQIVLLIRGNRVVLRDSGGGVSRGLIQGNVMTLKDPYGRSVWVRGR